MENEHFFSFITEDDEAIENTAVLIKEEGKVRIKMLWAERLSNGESCAPCSAARLAEYLNNIRN